LYSGPESNSGPEHFCKGWYPSNFDVGLPIAATMAKRTKPHLRWLETSKAGG